MGRTDATGGLRDEEFGALAGADGDPWAARRARAAARCRAVRAALADLHAALDPREVGYEGAGALAAERFALAAFQAAAPQAMHALAAVAAVLESVDGPAPPAGRVP